MPKPISIKPVMGGQLMSRVSAASVGPANYTVKRDLRRILDREAVREGYDYFRVHFTRSLSAQTTPGGLITAVFQMRGAGGRRQLLAASKGKIWRFVTLETHGYVADIDSNLYIQATGTNTPYLEDLEDGTSYFATDYNAPYWSEDWGDEVLTQDDGEVFTQDDGTVFTQGTGFSGYSGENLYVFNDPALWELIGEGFSEDARRWEIINVGDEAIFNNGVDLPVSFDLRDSWVKPLHELREIGVASVGTIAEHAGLLLCGDVVMIDDAALDDLFETDPAAAYDRITDPTITFRVPHRMIWSMNDEPRRFAPNFPCAAKAGSKIVRLNYAVQSLSRGDAVIVLGAGDEGGNLSTTIAHISGTTVRLADEAVTTDAETFIARADTSGTISAYEDIEDDGSPILRMLTLGNRLIIYRDGGANFIAAYTANINKPFEIVRRDAGRQTALYYRNTLTAIDWRGQTFHVFAGRNSFFRFDLGAQQPIEIQTFDVASNIFFDQATAERDGEVFAVNSVVTNEVMFFFPSTSADKCLAWDYKHGTLSTSAMRMTAACSIKKPLNGEGNITQTRDWLVMAQDLTMTIYGRTAEGETIWDGADCYFLRLGDAYSGTLTGGLMNFGDSFNEKRVLHYMLGMSSFSPDVVVTWELRAGRDENSMMPAVASTSIEANRLIPVVFEDYFFQGSITVTATGGAEIVEQVWDVMGARSDSFERRQV